MRKISERSFVNILYPIIITIFIFYRGCRLFSLVGNINISFLVVSCLLFGVWVFGSGTHVYIDKSMTLLLIFILYVVIDGIIRTQYAAEAFEYWSLLIAIIAFCLTLYNEETVVQNITTHSYKASIIMVSMIFLQAFFPSIVRFLQRIWFTPTGFETASYAYSRGYCTGLTSFSAAAVWYCFILMSFEIGKLFNTETNKLRHILMLIISAVAMLYTQKRSILIASVAAIYISILLFSKRRDSKFIRSIILSFFLVLIAWWAYHTIPQVQYMVFKTNRVGNALSGRDYYWNILLPMYKSSPLFGVGGGTAMHLFGFGGHNCYIQLLAEYGIVGLLLFLFGFGLPLVKSIIKAKIFLGQYRYTQKGEIFITSIIIQVVFFIYCFSGNPLFDQIFFMSEIICITISQIVLKESIRA